VQTTDQRLAWLIILATIPVGLAGLAFEHAFRVIFGKPVIAAVFLAVNGVILIAGERYRSRESLAADAALQEARARAAAATAPAQPLHPVPAAASGGLPADPPRYERDDPDAGIQADRRLAAMGYPRALVIGSAQILALLAGISRDGVAMVAGMTRGLSREDAARFAFLLATPVILAAGVLKVPDLAGHLGAGIHGQILFGSVLSGVGAYLSVRFLLRYLRTRTLTPFGVYCLIAGLASVAFLTLAR
jgi:undecaprenyl-diphosphatase